MATKKALIIGLSSQDGSYLADSLLEKGYQVVGTIRRSTNFYKDNINHLYGRVVIEAADLIDYESLESVMRKHQPQEIYNFAAQSVPADSWSHPMYTGEVTALGAVRVFEAMRKYAPEAKLYQATSREIFGHQAGRATENTPVYANNPYGIGKAYAHMMARCYRESYNLFICDGILFNHESPRRSLHFVTRKISAAVACLKNQVAHPPLNEAGEPLIDSAGKVRLGWLDAQRDWGYAKEYVDAIWLMMQHSVSQSYVIGTGISHTVKEACQIAFAHVGLNWEDYVVSDQKFFRPTEIAELVGDSTLAKNELGWEPKTTFKQLIELMVDADLERFK